MLQNNSIQIEDSYVLNRWKGTPPLSDSARICLVVVITFTLLIGLIGNTLVLVLFAKFRSLRTTANIFVINLTVADLLMCVLCLPILIKKCLSVPIYNEIRYSLCTFEAFLSAYTGFVSILCLTALSVDRCYVITRPIPVTFYDNKKHVYFAAILIWIIAGGGASLPILGFGKYVEDGSRVTCSFDFFTRSDVNVAYNITMQVFFFLLPIAVIITCYGIIVHKVRSHDKKYFRSRENGSCRTALRRIRKNRNHERNELQTARSGIILITAFCISWIPFCLVSYIGLYGDSSLVTPLAASIPAVFAKLSTILNPVLYALVHKRFKAKLTVFIDKYLERMLPNKDRRSRHTRALLYYHYNPGYNSTQNVLTGTRQENTSSM